MTVNEKQNLILQEKAQLITAIAQLEAAKKDIEKKEKDMRSQLQSAMEEYGVLLIDNDVLSVQYMPESTRETFDTKRFAEEYPGMYEEYKKTSQVKASIRIKAK